MTRRQWLWTAVRVVTMRWEIGGLNKGKSSSVNDAMGIAMRPLNAGSIQSGIL